MSSPSQLRPESAAPWHIIIPVKDPDVGKSRLATSLGSARARLSRALADDTVAAAAATVGPSRVVLVTSHRGLAASWARRGVVVVADPGSGLNAAIAAGLEAAPRGSAVGVLLGDLPAVTSGDLSAALAAAAVHAQSFVPDADGTGTVLRCRSLGANDFTPRFGPGSAARHEDDGAVRLDLALPRLRTDVDDAHSLALAAELGVGPATRSALDRHASGWIAPMQASVHTFDPVTRGGSVLRDDGLEVPFAAAAFDESGLRLLRTGQRLTVEVEDDRVVSLRIVGIGPDQRIR